MMVLKRPYLIMIKYFRLIHLFMSIISAYCIYKMNFLLKFFNEYLVNEVSIIGDNLQSSLVSGFLFFLIVVILIITLILLFTMLNKKKPVKFYLYNVLVYIFALFLMIYTSSFLGKMENSIVDIMVVRVLRDLFLISLFIQGISLIYCLIRTIGFDLKKFDFMADVESLNLDDENLDEIELSFDFDSNERRRLRKQKFNNLKFAYRENKFIIILTLIVFMGFSFYYVYSKIYLKNMIYSQGKNVNSEYYQINVNNSYITNYSKSGIKITNNYLLIVDLNIKSISFYNKFITGNLKLQVGDNVYSSTNKYDKYITDLGNVYKNDEISNKGNNYLFVFEIDSADIKKDKILYYYDTLDNLKIKLNPYLFNQELKSFNLNEEFNIDGDSFIVNSYDINDKMVINYELCLSDNCYNMKQNIVPTLNTNYDKNILKLEGVSNYSDSSKFKGFSQILANLGYIEYIIDGKSYISSMSQITNLNSVSPNVYYYEIRKEVFNADNIYLVLNTRKCKYRVILK